MSEEKSRTVAAARGRGSARGGRGGYASRGGRNSGRPNGEAHKDDVDTISAFEDSDVADLRSLYGSKVAPVKDMFPDWSEVDILYALKEADGDENLAVTRMAEGNVSQWGEVSKPKKASRAKPKDTPTSAALDSPARPARGGRVVSEAGRGRSRAPDRGGRPPRGRPAPPATNGTRPKDTPLSVPTEESNAWADSNGRAAKEVASVAPSAPEVVAEAPKPSSLPPKTWASMLRQSTAPKVAPKPKEAPPHAEVAEVPAPVDVPVEEPQPTADSPVEPEEIEEAEEAATPIVEPEIALPPPKDSLTETNLEQVVDTSTGPTTDTAASTTADSWDPRQSAATADVTPISASHQQHQQLHQTQPALPASGFAASAIKATDRANRIPSYKSSIRNQQEAVRMPGNRDVERAAIQFGNFGLTDDVDGEREEAETRAQPPSDSPTAPRASLPPVAQPAPSSDVYSSQKTQPALPAMPASVSVPASQQQAPAAQISALPTQNAQQQAFGRLVGSQEPSPSSFHQKPFDSFNQPSAIPVSQPGFDAVPHQQTQTSQGPSVPGDYSSYYGTDPQNRGPYNNYYNQHYGQQQHQPQHAAQAQQEGLPPSQPARNFGGYTEAAQAENLSQYPQSGSLPSRFGVQSGSQNSGHSTPNPPAQAQQQVQQQQGTPGSQAQSHTQQNYGNYHPYYNHPYYHQFYQGYGGGAFGGPYGNKGMYSGGPYATPYDHSSSPAAGFGQTTVPRGDNNALSSGLGDYSRSGAQGVANQPGALGSSFGSMHDNFRGGSTFQNQAGQGFGNASQTGASAVNDELKPYDTKSGAGPSPSLTGARPGSATNNAPAGQTGLPPQSASQMGGYGGYPNLQGGHGLHGSSAYGMGGAASGGQHGNYSSYGQGFGAGSYYGGQQQQQGQRGWGGNYH